MKYWIPGDRVTREVFMDDGTWQKEGDKCLKRSPLKHGVVRKVEDDGRDVMVTVQWDNGQEQVLLPHGIDDEIPTADEKTRLSGSF